MFWKKKERELPSSQLPQHIAIIMDGNGRWAKKRGLGRNAGHRAGAQAFKNIVLTCRDLGIPYLSVYAFSTENWKRPKEEVEGICSLLREYIKEVQNSLSSENVGLHFLGDLTAFDEELQESMKKVEQESSFNAAIHVNIAMNYGGRLELTQAMQAIGRQVQNGHLSPEEITEQVIENSLYTAGQPDPDLLIRPSGELRLSNFLLWQVAYSEFWFSDVLWPDFKKKHLLEAIEAFQRRNRRFGGV